MEQKNILEDLRTHLRIPAWEFSNLIGINRVTYSRRANNPDLDLSEDLTLKQYINLRNACSDSIYCQNLLDEFEREIGL